MPIRGHSPCTSCASWSPPRLRSASIRRGRPKPPARFRRSRLLSLPEPLRLRQLRQPGSVRAGMLTARLKLGRASAPGHLRCECTYSDDSYGGAYQIDENTLATFLTAKNL